MSKNENNTFKLKYDNFLVKVELYTVYKILDSKFKHAKIVVKENMSLNRYTYKKRTSIFHLVANKYKTNCILLYMVALQR